jgi:hypothetical protein
MFFVTSPEKNLFNQSADGNDILQDMRVNFACSDIHRSFLIPISRHGKEHMLMAISLSRFFESKKERMSIAPSLIDNSRMHRSFLTIAPSSSRLLQT